MGKHFPSYINENKTETNWVMSKGPKQRESNELSQERDFSKEQCQSQDQYKFESSPVPPLPPITSFTVSSRLFMR